MTKYSYQGSMDNAAKAYGRRLRISTKHGIEVCKAIKHEHVDDARNMLEAAVNEEEPIEFTRYSEGAGHKKGAGMGKYPVKAGEEILKVLNGAVANAQHQGLSSDLKVEHAAAHKAEQTTKYGRHAGRTEKGTHIELVVKEVPGATRTEEDKAASATDTSDETDVVADAPETVEDSRADTDSSDEGESDADTEEPDQPNDTADETEGGDVHDADSTVNETAEDAETVDEQAQAEETPQTRLPDDGWTVPEIKQYLDDNDIDYTSDDLKADLLDKAQEETT